MSANRKGYQPFMELILSPSMTRKRLQAMNTSTVAKHYRIPEQWVTFNRDWQLEVR